MGSPIRKRVSDDVFERISGALGSMAVQMSSPRTKREIERLSGLSHDTVARAFKQDQLEETRWKISARFLTVAKASTGGRSPDQQQLFEARQKIAELSHKNRDLEAALDTYAATLLAYHLSSSEILASDRAPANVTPMMGRNRRGRGK